MQSLKEQAAWVKSQADHVEEVTHRPDKIKMSADTRYIGMCILFAANMLCDKLEEIRKEMPPS